MGGEGRASKTAHPKEQVAPAHGVGCSREEFKGLPSEKTRLLSLYLPSHESLCQQGQVTVLKQENTAKRSGSQLDLMMKHSMGCMVV